MNLMGRLLALLLVPMWAQAASVRVELNGVEGAARENVLALTELAVVADRSDLSETYIKWLFQQAQAQVKLALEPYGYYRASVESSISESADGFVVVLNVDTGPATTVAEVSVAVSGPGGSDTQVSRAILAFPLKVGDPLDHTRYENGKTAVADALAARGYFGVERLEHRVELSPDLAQASIKLAWHSGERYQFGQIIVQGGPVSHDIVMAQAPFSTGDPWDQLELDRYYARLMDTGYFAVVSIVPLIGQAEGLSIPLQIVLQEQRRNVYEAGVNWSTDSGPGVDAAYTRRWLRARGDRLYLAASLATKRKFATLRYHIPSRNPPVLGYDAGATYLDEETDSRRSKITEFSLSQSRDLYDWRLVSSVSYRQEDFIAGEGAGDSSLLVLAGDLSYINMDGIYPRSGYTLNFNLRGGADAVASDTDFIQLEARGLRILPVSDFDRLLLRLHLGATVVDEVTDLPPGYRFYAGGDRSIRGYDYEALGPVDDEGNVIGGRYLAVASIEYEKHIKGPWGMAFFLDAGNALDDHFSEIAYGLGIGLRWASPIGPLRLDLAAAPKEPGTPVRLHFGLGPAL